MGYPVRLHGSDGMIEVPEVYPVPRLRPASVTWCARCRTIQCARHGMRTFWAQGVGDDGVWEFGADWPVRNTGTSLPTNAQWIYGPEGRVGGTFLVACVDGTPPSQVVADGQRGVLWGTAQGVHQYYVEPTWQTADKPS